MPFNPHAYFSINWAATKENLRDHIPDSPAKQYADWYHYYKLEPPAVDTITDESRAPEKLKKERKEKPKASGSKMLEKQVRALEREIEKQEQLSAQLDTQIEAAASDYQELARLTEEKQACDDTLTGLMDEWERLSSDLEGAT